MPGYPLLAYVIQKSYNELACYEIHIIHLLLWSGSPLMHMSRTIRQRVSQHLDFQSMDGFISANDPLSFYSGDLLLRRHHHHFPGGKFAEGLLDVTPQN